MGFLHQFDAFHELAAKATGLDDFGAADYVEPLKLLLSDYDKYCRFDETGVQMISAGTVGQLVGRLFAQQGFKTHPEFAQAPIERPIIITGMLRTGSTALQRLLSQDPTSQSLPFWLANTPMPRPPRETWADNPWYRMAVQGVEQLFQMSPHIRQSHPIAPAEADECHNTVSQSFWSPGLAMSAAAPEYKEWCMSCDPRYAYRRHRRVLGLVAGGDTRRWLLKDPTHMFGLDALLDVFPDACIVYTHRDPVTAMTSAASLMYALRRLREPDLPAEQHGGEVLAFLGRAQAKAELIRSRHDPARFFDVHINELQADPAGTAERIYRHFKLPVTEEARASWRRHGDTDPRAGHGVHHYKMEDFGFTAREVYDSIGPYYARYNSLYQDNAA